MEEGVYKLRCIQASRCLGITFVQLSWQNFFFFFTGDCVLFISNTNSLNSCHFTLVPQTSNLKQVTDFICPPPHTLTAPDSSFLERLNAVEEELDCSPAYAYSQVTWPTCVWTHLISCLCPSTCLFLSVSGQESSRWWRWFWWRLSGLPHTVQTSFGQHSSGSAGGGASGPGYNSWHVRAERRPVGGGQTLDKVAAGSSGPWQPRPGFASPDVFTTDLCFY